MKSRWTVAGELMPGDEIAFEWDGAMCAGEILERVAPHGGANRSWRVLLASDGGPRAEMEVRFRATDRVVLTHRILSTPAPLDALDAEIARQGADRGFDEDVIHEAREDARRTYPVESRLAALFLDEAATRGPGRLAPMSIRAVADALWAVAKRLHDADRPSIDQYAGHLKFLASELYGIDARDKERLKRRAEACAHTRATLPGTGVCPDCGSLRCDDGTWEPPWEPPQRVSRWRGHDVREANAGWTQAARECEAFGRAAGREVEQPIASVAKTITARIRGRGGCAPPPADAPKQAPSEPASAGGVEWWPPVTAATAKETDDPRWAVAYGGEWREPLWEAIRVFIRACGADVMPADVRAPEDPNVMRAVADVESVVRRAILRGSPNRSSP